MWHAEQATFACPLVSRKPVTLWSKVAFVQPNVVWHVAHFAKGNSAAAFACGGLLVCCQVAKWHPEFSQSVGPIVRL